MVQRAPQHLQQIDAVRAGEVGNVPAVHLRHRDQRDRVVHHAVWLGEVEARQLRPLLVRQGVTSARRVGTGLRRRVDLPAGADRRRRPEPEHVVGTPSVHTGQASSAGQSSRPPTELSAAVGVPGLGCSRVAVAECFLNSGNCSVMSSGRGGVVRIMAADPTTGYDRSFGPLSLDD